jgi:hypothetical protein
MKSKPLIDAGPRHHVKFYVELEICTLNILNLPSKDASGGELLPWGFSTGEPSGFTG